MKPTFQRRKFDKKTIKSITYKLLLRCLHRHTPLAIVGLAPSSLMRLDLDLVCILFGLFCLADPLTNCRIETYCYFSQ